MQIKVDFYPTESTAEQLDIMIREVARELGYRGMSMSVDAAAYISDFMTEVSATLMITNLRERAKIKNWGNIGLDIQKPVEVTAPINLTPLASSERLLIMSQQKISAIKAYRSRHPGCGLRDAKDQIDAYSARISTMTGNEIQGDIADQRHVEESEVSSIRALAAERDWNR